MESWQWQVPVCALIFILPTAIAIRLLLKRTGGGGGRATMEPSDLWATCWRSLHPRWLLLYRAFPLKSPTSTRFMVPINPYMNHIKQRLGSGSGMELLLPQGDLLRLVKADEEGGEM
ncbi:glutamate--tRNA ligase 1 [Striga asiatica]|uniref:Glutamate--tRNA ligase 1 n=1 Tax=Striga asiatica TaxID=4170 RepID=A0A5A7P601_STRAF|nr:glutamate--tRNA ligase 1 [Striga asiatica]